MNKGMEKMIAKAVVGVAVQSAKLPNQKCVIFLGKPKERINLEVSDYEKLESFMKNNS